MIPVLGIEADRVEQPISELVTRAAPLIVFAATAAALYLALLSGVHAEARARVREYERLRQAVEALERHGVPGAPRSCRLAAARARVTRLREDLVRAGLLPRDRLPV